MTEKLTTFQAQVVVIFIGIALSALIGSVSYLFVAQSKLSIRQAGMADKYLLVSQYRVDAKRTDATVCRLEEKFEAFASRMDGKLDKIIMRQN